MRSTLEDCFRELIRDKILEYMEKELETLTDEDIDSFVEDPYSFHEYIENNWFDIGFDSDVECFNIINNDVRLFQEMFEYIQKDEDDFVYTGIVLNVFDRFVINWGKEQIMGEDGIYMDMISEALEKEATERDRQREIKQLMPLVINRLAIPNELTQNIMLMVGERC